MYVCACTYIQSVRENYHSILRMYTQKIKSPKNFSPYLTKSAFMSVLSSLARLSNLLVSVRAISCLPASLMMSCLSSPGPASRTPPVGGVAGAGQGEKFKLPIQKEKMWLPYTVTTTIYILIIMLQSGRSIEQLDSVHT